MKGGFKSPGRGTPLSVIAALLLLALVSIGTLGAARAPKQPTTWTKLSSSGTTTSAATVITATYPSDCTARSDYPHLGKYSNYTAVDAKGWTICSIQRPSEHVDSTLYRQDCFLFICWLTQVGYDSKTGPPQWFTYGTVRAVPSHTCSGSSSHYYEIDSYHQLTDFDGTVWYRYSSNSATVGCG